MQVCISLQTDDHDSTPPLNFFNRPDALPVAETNSVKALKANVSALPTRQNVQTKNLFSLKCCIQLNETSTSRCLMSSILLTCDLYFTLTCDCLNLIISAVHCYVVKGRTIIKRSAVRSSHSGSLTVLHTLYASALSCCEKKMSSATCLISINLC